MRETLNDRCKKCNKNYGNVKALDSISISFDDGKIYGLLGSNGAGKTTLMKIIANRAFPTSGYVYVNGEISIENEFVQKDIFYVSVNDKYPGDMRMTNLLRWEKRFFENFDVEYASRLAKKFELDLSKKPSELSTGYYTIFKVIVSLASNAPMIILDEPVLGIDSLYRELFYESLLENQRRNKNLILIATHLIDEVEPVLEDVIIIDQGQILSRGSKEEMTRGQSLNKTYVEILKEARRG